MAKLATDHNTGNFIEFQNEDYFLKYGLFFKWVYIIYKSS